MNVLEFLDVNFSYSEDDVILENLSFSIEKPKLVSIIGRSGCGKSTIFKLILSLLERNSGKISYRGQDVTALSSYAGYMPQSDMLFPWKTIEKNLSLPMDIKHIDKKVKKEKIEKILEDMDLIATKNKYPYELSGGMRQRISFARTILTDSDLLLFDEPLSKLDYITRVNMQKWLLKELRKYENKTAIFITHDIDEAIFLSDEILVVTETPIKKLEKIVLPNEKDLSQKNIIELKKDLLNMVTKEQL